MARLTWHGHSCFSLETDAGLHLLLDPWLDDNPMADIGADDVSELDFMLCSHGHYDHFADAIAIARRTGASLIGIYELVSFAKSQGVSSTYALNIGGGQHFPFGRVKMTPAVHSGTIHGDETGRYTTLAGGFWIHLKPKSGETGGTRVYHAGDTALTSDMQLLKGKVDIALLPIGDTFTMGPVDAVRAVEMIAPAVVIPMHYNTFDAIRQDPADFARRVGDLADVVILEPGSSHVF
jgi:L-ascorbate metabolism protein UlaG (beta-lactamase superfamily)